MFEGAYSDDASEENVPMGYSSASTLAPVFQGGSSEDAAGIGVMLSSPHSDNHTDDLDVGSGYQTLDGGLVVPLNALGSESSVARSSAEVGRVFQLVPRGFPKIGGKATPYTTTVFGMGAIALLTETERKYAALVTNAALANGKDNAFLDHESGHYYEHIFAKRLKTDNAHRATSWTQAASEANTSQSCDKNSASRYRARFLETAEALMASSRLLAASYAAKVLNLITGAGRNYRGTMLSFALQGDEATKEMRVPDESEPSADLPSILGDQNAESHIMESNEAPSIVVAAKVQYSELRVSFLLEHIETGEFVHSSIDLPCPLQHLDRTTSNNLTAAQEDLISLPGFTNELMVAFKHIGVLPTQDKSGGNEKQVNCASVVDRKLIHGDKPRFRVANVCGIHGWARCMTSQFYMFNTWVSGAIAYAITQRGPNKLPELRRIIGDRLVQICVICRNPPCR